MKNRIIRHPLLFVFLLLAALSPRAVLAQVPPYINYQGRVLTNGVTFTGTGTFTFTLVDGGGNSYWSSGITTLPVVRGLYSTPLGPLPPAIFTNTLLLRVTFNDGLNGTQQFQDQPITSSGYALMANSANSLSGTLPSAQLSGTYSSRLALNNPSNTFNGSFSGDGSGLTNLNPGAVGAIVNGLTNVWLVGGDNLPSGPQLLGTMSSDELAIIAGGHQAIQIIPSSISGAVVAKGTVSPHSLPIGGIPRRSLASRSFLAWVTLLCFHQPWALRAVRLIYSTQPLPGMA